MMKRGTIILLTIGIAAMLGAWYLLKDRIPAALVAPENPLSPVQVSGPVLPKIKEKNINGIYTGKTMNFGTTSPLVKGNKITGDLYDDSNFVINAILGNISYKPGILKAHSDFIIFE